MGEREDYVEGRVLGVKLVKGRWWCLEVRETLGGRWTRTGA
jgi:hypothetical protein